MTDATSRNPFRWVVRMPRARPRLLAAIGVGIIVGVTLAFLGTEIDRSTRLILSWDALAVTFLVSMMLSMIQHSPTEIRARAVLDDEGKGVILALVLVAAAASVWAVGDELSLAKDAHGIVKLGRVVLAFGTVMASWMMVQMIFALHYAHEYYGVDEDDGARDAGGLEFPGNQDPDYWDFLHFSIVIGVACATADVNFTSKGLRQLGTVHSLVAFAFNTVIVALTI
ncbi:MAG TPA: DUF1345 domain-containing protein, partial [Phenylobacterium sp.]